MILKAVAPSPTLCRHFATGTPLVGLPRVPSVRMLSDIGCSRRTSSYLQYLDGGRDPFCSNDQCPTQLNTQGNATTSLLRQAVVHSPTVVNVLSSRMHMTLSDMAEVKLSA